MNGHVSKPVDPDLLFEVLAGWIPETGSLEPANHSGPAVGAGTASQPAAPAPRDPASLIDTQAGLRYFGGKLPSYRRMLARFADSHGTAAARLQAALDEGDMAGAERMAHSLKGVGATLGMGPLAALAGAIEQKIHNGAPGHALSADCAALDDVLTAVVAEIEAQGLDGDAPAPALADPSRVVELTTRLCGELAADAYEAKPTWLELSPHLKQAIGANALAPLSHLIESYDFTEALVELRRLLAEQPLLTPIRQAVDACAGPPARPEGVALPAP